MNSKATTSEINQKTAEKIGDEYGTARELSEKYGIPVDKIYRLYGGKNSEKM